MREIKFRAFDREEKNFIYFSPITGLYQECDAVYHKRNVGPVEQFTGLHDKNGTEIYEGDIVQTSYGETGVVLFHGTSFVAKSLPPHDWDPMSPAFNLGVADITITGNIHER